VKEIATPARNHSAMNDNIYAHIEGSSKLMSLFGSWPTFRRAAVVYMRVDRKGPTVTIAFELKEWGDTHPGETVNATLRWTDVTEFAINGIAPDPALDGLSLAAIAGGIKTTLDGQRGPHGCIVSGGLRILDVVIVED
jgi:hypothetical protein